MAARNLTPPFPFRRNALAVTLRQVLQQRRWQALLAAGLVGLAPASLGDAFLADLSLASLDGTNGFKLSGAAAYDFSGYSVSDAGDINGDGMDDILIGAPRADVNGQSSGASYVVFGGSKVGDAGNLNLADLDGTNGFRLSGEAAFYDSGGSVSAAGDVNGDGTDDILIGALGADPNGAYSGASYVVFGGPGVGSTGTFELSMLDGSNGFKLSGMAAGDELGRSVSSAGDVNGDGTDDILIGADLADPNGEGSGASYVVFGGSGIGGTGTFDLSMPDGTNGFRVSGVAAYDFSGGSVSAAGDVNDDGVDDILIGANGADPNGAYSGASYVVFGGSGVGSTGNLNLGDLDGSNGFKLSGVAADDDSSLSVSDAGDVNGDGTDDILIGAPFADPNGAYSGASYVVFGGSGVGGSGNFNLASLDGSNGFKLSGVAAYDFSGGSVSAAGDVNGDGTDDILIGANGAANGFGAGTSYVVFGGSGVGGTGNLNLADLDGTNGFKLSGVAANDSSGDSVSAAGDVNGDGREDLLIGALGADPNGDLSGATYVVFGERAQSPTVTCHGLTATLVGTPAGETLNGTKGRDVIHGLGGDDTIIGGGGDDVLCGGRGDDVLRGNRGNDRLIGGRGTDRCDGGSPVKGDTASSCKSVRGVL